MGLDTVIKVRLGDICEKIGSGATPRGGSEVYIEKGVALIRSQNIYNDGFRKGGLAFIDNNHADELSNVIVESGDILLNITGDSVARVCQVNDEVLPARVNQHVAIIRPKKDILDARYLRYFLVNPVMQGHMLGLAAAGATRNALTKGMIEGFEVPAPPLSEQHAIAHILGTLDDKIELNRRTNETLEAIARAIFQSWFVDFDPVRAKSDGRQPEGLDAATAALFPDSFEGSELGEIPKGWKWGTIGSLADLNTRTLGRNDKLDVIDYIEISNVMQGEISAVIPYKRGTEPSRARRRLTHGDTVLSTVRPDRGAYFLCLNPPDTLIASTGFTVATPKNGSWAFLHAALTRSEIGEELGFLADGGAYPAIRPEVISALSIVIPQIRQIVDAYERISQPLFEKADCNRKASLILAAIRDALLPKLLSGEVRIRDAESWLEAPR